MPQAFRQPSDPQALASGVLTLEATFTLGHRSPLPANCVSPWAQVLEEETLRRTADLFVVVDEHGGEV